MSAQIAMLALTLISGLGSAFFWWRSASVRFEITTRDEGENTDAGAFIFEKDVVPYLRRVSRENTRAAVLGAVSVTSGVIGTLLALAH